MEVSGTRGTVDVVVPLKRLDGAKSRLRTASGASTAPDVAHRELVLALARDTVAAVRAGSRVGRILLVTGEPELAAADLGAPSLATLPDPGAGLNAALRAGAEHLRAPSGGRRAVAAIQADLPALDPAELDDAMGAALARFRTDGSPAAFVADRQGTGTTLLVAAPGTTLRPFFGPGSAAAHRAAGAVALDGSWPGLRADVDTPEDLHRVRLLGCGPATAAWAFGVDRPLAGRSPGRPRA